MSQVGNKKNEFRKGAASALLNAFLTFLEGISVFAASYCKQN